MKKMLVTTTSSIEGCPVQKYFDPVSANVVLGTNVFSDISATWRDFWGGNMGVYERKLQKIYEEVVAKLKKKAGMLDANALIGLKIDIDEISGGGKQMFMITAVATPIRYSDPNEKDPYDKNSINGTLVETRVKANKLLNAKISPDKLYSDEHVEFITESQLPDFMRMMLDGLKYFCSDEGLMAVGSDVAEGKRAAIISYFGELDASLATPVIYHEFTTGDNVKYFKELMNIIIAHNLYDYEQAATLIRSQSLLTAKYGLWISAMAKRHYSPGDISEIERLIPLIKSEFQPIVQVTTKKKLLGGSDKEIWTCTCYTTNDMDVVHCAKCNNDIYGFAKGEKIPEHVVTILESRLTVLKEVMQQHEPSTIAI